MQNTDIVVKHDFTVMKSARHTVLLRNDFSQNAGFIVEQQWPEVYLKRRLKQVGLSTPKLPSLSQMCGKPVELVTKVHISREQELPPCSVPRVECLL